MRPFEKLDAWKLGHELNLRIYKVSGCFPDHERYGLTAQVRRAASSVPANVAEGSAAPSKREFRRYLAIALRSLNEVSHWLIQARDLEYVEQAEWRRLDALRNRTGKVIWRLSKSLEQ